MSVYIRHAWGGQKMTLEPLELTYRQLRATMWVLEIDPGSLTRMLSHFSSAPAPASF